MKFGIQLGALTPPIHEQLDRQGVKLTDDDSKRFEKASKSITFLHIQGIMSSREMEKCRRRLVAQIENCAFVEEPRR